MAMAQAEAAQPTELQPSSDTGQNLLPEGHEVAELLRDTFHTISSVWADITGNKPDTVANAASLVVNGKAPFETVSGQLTDLSKQGKLNDLSTYFDAHYSVGLRDQLVQNYPGREAAIDQLLGTKTTSPDEPKLGGLTIEQLQAIHNDFPALKGVIDDPRVLGAIVQNEKDHTYHNSDSIIDGAFRGFHRTFGDSTEFMSNLKTDELREKAKENGGIVGYFQEVAANIRDRILRVSMGDGQVQIRNILALQDQERQAGRDIPTISSSLTPEGAAKLVGAYFTKSIEVLSNNQASDPSKNPFLDTTRPSVVKGFAEAQRLWNTGDPVLRERAVMMTYNAGISNSNPEAWNPEHILKHYLKR